MMSDETRGANPSRDSGNTLQEARAISSRLHRCLPDILRAIDGGVLNLDFTLHAGGLVGVTTAVVRHLDLAPRSSRGGPPLVSTAQLAAAVRGLPESQSDVLARCVRPLLANLPWYRHGDIRLSLSRGRVWLAPRPRINMLEEHPLVADLMDLR